MSRAYRHAIRRGRCELVRLALGVRRARMRVVVRLLAVDLLDVELGAAIALLVLARRVRDERIARRTADGDEPVALDALRDEPLEHRDRAMVAEVLVVRLAAVAVGVAFDPHARDRRVVLEDLEHRVERAARLARRVVQLRLVRLELDRAGDVDLGTRRGRLDERGWWLWLGLGLRRLLQRDFLRRRRLDRELHFGAARTARSDDDQQQRRPHASSGVGLSSNARRAWSIAGDSRTTAPRRCERLPVAGKVARTARVGVDSRREAAPSLLADLEHELRLSGHPVRLGAPDGEHERGLRVP